MAEDDVFHQQDHVLMMANASRFALKDLFCSFFAQSLTITLNSKIPKNRSPTPKGTAAESFCVTSVHLSCLYLLITLLKSPAADCRCLRGGGGGGPPNPNVHNPFSREKHIGSQWSI